MTDEDFLKPPSAGIWMVLAICGGVLGNAFLGPVFEPVAAGVLLIAGAIAVYVVLRWLGRVTGYLVGEFVEGYQSGQAKAKQRRGEPAS